MHVCNKIFVSHAKFCELIKRLYTQIFSKETFCEKYFDDLLCKSLMQYSIFCNTTALAMDVDIKEKQSDHVRLVRTTLSSYILGPKLTRFGKCCSKNLMLIINSYVTTVD